MSWTTCMQGWEEGGVRGQGVGFGGQGVGFGGQGVEVGSQGGGAGYGSK